MSKSKNKANSKARPRANKFTMSAKPTGQYTNASNRPVLYRSAAPTVTNTPSGVRVRNTEQLLATPLFLAPGDTKGFVGMNPADPGGFPWLSRVAAAYAKFKFHKLVLSYVPYVGTGTNGYVSAASIYDSEDALRYFAALTSVNLSNQPEYTIGPLYAGNTIRTHDDKVDSSNWLGIEFNCRQMNDGNTKWYYVDPGASAALGAGNEARLNQTVPCYAALQYNLGGTTSLTVGSWYVTYDCEFIQPTNPSIQLG